MGRDYEGYSRYLIGILSQNLGVTEYTAKTRVIIISVYSVASRVRRFAG